MKIPKLTLEDISKYTPQMGVGRVILDDICEYIPKIAKGIGTMLPTVVLVYSLAGCPSPSPPPPPDDDEEPVVIYDESEGAKIIAEEASKRGLTIGYNIDNVPVSLTYGGDSTTFIPDIFLINGGLLYGEFVSDADGLTTQQRNFIESYNNAPGDPTGKTLLADPDTASNIRARVNNQFDDWGL